MIGRYIESHVRRDHRLIHTRSPYGRPRWDELFCFIVTESICTTSTTAASKSIVRCANTDEAVAKKAPLVEIIPGKGSGQLKKRVLRFLDREDIKPLCQRVEKDSDSFGRIFIHSCWSNPSETGASATRRYRACGGWSRDARMGHSGASAKQDQQH